VFFRNEWGRYPFFFLILTSSFHGGCRGLWLWLWLWLRTHTGNTPLEEGLASRRDFYLKKEKEKKNVTLIRDIHVPAGLEHSAAADRSLRPPATGIGVEDIIENKFFVRVLLKCLSSKGLEGCKNIQLRGFCAQ